MSPHRLPRCHHHYDWFILGAGAMGCLWAAYLCKTGFRVCLLLSPRPEYEQLRQYTLTLEVNGQRQYFQVDGISSDVWGQHHPGSDMKNIVVATKAPVTESAITSIRPCIKPGARLILLQNGLGSQQAVAELLPDCRIFAGVSTDGAWCRQPLHVVHAGQGKTILGVITVNPHAISEKTYCRFPEELLPGTGLVIEETPTIMPVLLRKLAINCAINPLTAIYRCPNGALASNHRYSQHVSRLCAEIQSVMDALGYANELADIEASVREVIDRTAANTSSMLQDIQAGRPTEIHFITGYLLLQAHHHRIACPENQAAFKQVTSLSCTKV